MFNNGEGSCVSHCDLCFSLFIYVGFVYIYIYRYIGFPAYVFFPLVSKFQAKQKNHCSLEMNPHVGMSLMSPP